MHTPIEMTIAHYIICSFGMFSNAILFIIALTKTPKEMKTYGSVLATSAVVDFSVALSSGLTFAKVEILEIYALTGLSNYFGSFLLSIHLFAVALGGHAYFAYNITFCFCYRLYAIKKGVPSKRATFTAIFFILLPNVADVFYFANSDFIHSEEIIPQLISFNRTIVPEWDYFVFRDLKAVRTYLSCNVIVTPFPVAYVIILIVYRKIKAALAEAAGSMSSKTKKAHVEILKGLIMQSCLPIIDVIGVAFFWVSQYNEIKSEAAGHLLLKCFEIVVSLHPLTCLYFVRPYRMAISRFLGGSSAIHKSSQNLSVRSKKGSSTMTTPILLTLIHYIICTFGMLSNSTLLYVSATKSPKEMKTYGAVLGTSAVVDFLVAVSSCLTFAKVEILEIYALTGICNYFGSFALTIHLFAVAICGHAFFAYNITICFCFRLYAIRKGVPSKRATLTALAICLLPNVANVFYFASSDFVHGEELVPELLSLNRTIFPEWTYFVYRDKEGFRTWSSIFMIVMPFPAAYVTILVVFLQIRAALRAAASSMSSKTKEAHVEIIKGLLIQSCLPVIDVLGVAFFWVTQYYEIKSDAAGHFLLKCFELVVSLHPLTCLYFVRPYRIAISRSLGNSSATTIQKSSQSNTSGKKVSA